MQKNWEQHKQLLYNYLYMSDVDEKSTSEMEINVYQREIVITDTLKRQLASTGSIKEEIGIYGDLMDLLQNVDAG